jgi:hypothetical protein
MNTAEVKKVVTVKCVIHRQEGLKVTRCPTQGFRHLAYELWRSWYDSLATINVRRSSSARSSGLSADIIK